MNLITGIEKASNEPLYNIGVVSRMTGLTMATLRAWERRYNFPIAQRTMGGHRLYSEGDVLSLQWVKTRIDNGMQTSQAIHALEHQRLEGDLKLLETQGTDVLLDHEQMNYPHLAFEQLIAALMNKDLRDAERILNDILVMNSPEDVILNIISPALNLIGEEWESGNISISTEHLATNFLRQKLMMWMVGAPPPRQISPVILACAPNEWHEGSLLIIGALLRRRRIPVVYMGQAVPLKDIVSVLDEIKPSITVIIAMMKETAEALIDWPSYMVDTVNSYKPVIGYGGRAFTKYPELHTRMSGEYLGDTFSEGIRKIESYV